jgi:hypothetical protein
MLGAGQRVLKINPNGPIRSSGFVSGPVIDPVGTRVYILFLQAWERRFRKKFDRRFGIGLFTKSTAADFIEGISKIGFWFQVPR